MKSVVVTVTVVVTVSVIHFVIHFVTWLPGFPSGLVDPPVDSASGLGAGLMVIEGAAVFVVVMEVGLTKVVFVPEVMNTYVVGSDVVVGAGGVSGFPVSACGSAGLGGVAVSVVAVGLGSGGGAASEVSPGFFVVLGGSVVAVAVVVVVGAVVPGAGLVGGAGRLVVVIRGPPEEADLGGLAVLG